MAASSRLSDLLLAWAHGQPYRLDDEWTLLPPHEGAELTWGSIPDTPGRPLLHPLPTATSPHTIYWLEGSGVQVDEATRAMISEAQLSVGFSTEHYLGSAWSSQSEYLTVAIPVPAAVDARYDRQRKLARVEIRCGQPLRLEDFWARVSPDHWDESQPLETIKRVACATAGWEAGLVEVPIEAGTAFNVWVSMEGPQNEFRWHGSVPCGAPETLATTRASFLHEWYRLANRSLADHLGPFPPTPTKGQQSADAFEVALANLCSSAGHSVYFGGGTLKTPGLDFIAFNETAGRAYAVSVTVSNDVGAKTRGWLRVRPIVDAALTPRWEVRPVVVSASPRAVISQTDLGLAHQDGVTVMTAEDLAGLKVGDIRALDAFRARLDAAP